MMERIAPERPNHLSPILYQNHPFEEGYIKKRFLRDEPITEPTTNTTDDDDGQSVVSEYKPIRISFEISDTVEDVAVIDLLQTQILPPVAEIWANALSVVPVIGTLVTTNNSVTCRQIMEENDTNMEVTNTDLLIQVSFNRFCMSENYNQLASAISCQRDQFDRPVTGLIDFCTGEGSVLWALINSLSSNRKLQQNTNENQARIKQVIDVAVHEVGHVLGFSSYSLAFFRNPNTGEALTSRPLTPKISKCIDGGEQTVFLPSENTLKAVYEDDDPAKRVKHFEVVTPTVATITRNHFDCQKLEGAKLENQANSPNDCFGSHWDERLFFTESMGAIYHYNYFFLSALTLAFFEDSGWYRANYKEAKISFFGMGAGCDFVEKPCIVNGALPDYSKGSFCNVTLNSRQVCDPSYTMKTNCDLVDSSKEPNLGQAPMEFRYFDDPFLRPKSFDEADYCPVPYQNYLTCKSPFIEAKHKELGEVHSPKSLCYETNQADALCLKSSCDARNNKLKVFVLGKTYICNYDFEVHKLDEKWEFECPRFSHACPHLFTCPYSCSGKGICNYTSTVACAQNVCGYRPSCNCFGINDTSVDCSETPVLSPIMDHLQNDLFVEIIVISTLIVGLAVFFGCWKWNQQRGLDEPLKEEVFE